MYSRFEQVRPAFGASEVSLKNFIRNGIISYGPSFEAVLTEGKTQIDQVKGSDVTPLVSMLLEGQIGTGKTAIAVTLAMSSGFPFVKMISPDELIGYSEYQKS